MKTVSHARVGVIVGAVASVVAGYLVSVALPVYQDYAVREKVEQGLSYASSAKQDIQKVCQANEDSMIEGLWRSLYDGDEQTSEFVQEVAVHGGCDNMVLIEVLTRNTGAQPNPGFTLAGRYDDTNGGKMVWHCVASAGELRHMPVACRNSWSDVIDGLLPH